MQYATLLMVNTKYYSDNIESMKSIKSLKAKVENIAIVESILKLHKII